MKATPCDWATTHEEYRAKVREFAAAVFSDMPTANIDALMATGMKLSKGTMSPHLLNEAFYELMNPRATSAKNDD